MAKLHFTDNLRRYLPDPPKSGEGTTVRDVLDDVFRNHDHLRSYLLDDQGRLRKHVKIFVNDETIADPVRLSDPVSDSDEILIFQALSGG